MPPLQLTDLDESIWREELEDFVPSRVFDAHTHVYRTEFNLAPRSPLEERLRDKYPVSDLNTLQRDDALMLPGRELHYLTFGHPFLECDFEGLNAHTAETVSQDPQSAALMIVSPKMVPESVRDTIVRHGFLGMKPYRFYSVTGDVVECRITDILPEPLIEVANELGLIVTLHMGKRKAIGDPENIEDVVRLSKAYPRVNWVLAHCARSFAPWPIEAAWPHLAELPNVYLDTSAVCESDVFAVLLRHLDRKRILYGSDNSPAGIERGKYITVGHAWAFVGERTKSLDLSHCDPRATFACYESLRALRRAALALDVPQAEIDGIFWDNAVGLVDRVREGLTKR